MNQNKRSKTQKMIHCMVGIAILSAIVVVLQLLGSFIKIGPVSICLVLLPIVIGAAAYGPGAGAFLGAVCSVVVLCQPDTVFFFDISPLGTILTVCAKGILSGWLSGLAYRFIAKKNTYLAAIVAAIVCPVVNTGLFFLGCRLFFWNDIAKLCSGNVANYIITVFIGFNFVAELGMNIICAPAIPSIIRATRKSQ